MARTITSGFKELSGHRGQTVPTAPAGKSRCRIFSAWAVAAFGAERRTEEVGGMGAIQMQRGLVDRTLASIS